MPTPPPSPARPGPAGVFNGQAIQLAGCVPRGGLSKPPATKAGARVRGLILPTQRDRHKTTASRSIRVIGGREDRHLPDDDDDETDLPRRGEARDDAGRNPTVHFSEGWKGEIWSGGSRIIIHVDGWMDGWMDRQVLDRDINMIPHGSFLLGFCIQPATFSIIASTDVATCIYLPALKKHPRPPRTHPHPPKVDPDPQKTRLLHRETCPIQTKTDPLLRCPCPR
ncbi:hypothetical protein B0T19DRAFT_211521 [Cercophora scortea]|uniref:Uncharacterized protein n=1 Tax=Cercophora scortea TaxID=314031 RepID=A0AAE0IEX1_9PEZI|nr:hypothetical protein B0T19DRAFT_211521 [Cercophora scortea]